MNFKFNKSMGGKCVLIIGVGRCSDLGGRHFFKQQKSDFLLPLVDTNEEHLQYYNTAMKFIICKQWVKLGGGGRLVPLPPGSYAYANIKTCFCVEQT